MFRNANAAIWQQQLNRYFIAQMFLTRLPAPRNIRWSEKELAASTLYFPAIGIPVGVFASIAWWCGHYGWSDTVAAIFAVAAAVLVTGAFHEDGLADSADGIGGAFEVRKKLAIMRDSRIGTYGSIALLLVVVAKIASISLLTIDDAVATLIGAHVIARWTSVPLIYNNNYVREEGTGKPFASAVTPQCVLVSSIFTLLCTIFCFGSLAPIIVGVVLISTLIAQWYSRLKIGGITGDILGAINSVTELLIYLVVSSRWLS